MNKLRLRWYLLIPFAIVFINSSLDEFNQSLKDKYITSWINIDSLGNPYKIILFDSSNVIFIKKFKYSNKYPRVLEYTLSPHLIGPMYRSGVSLKLNVETNHIEVGLYDYKGYIQDTLVGLFRYIGHDTLVVSWSNEWTKKNELYFVRETKYPYKELSMLNILYSYLNNFYNHYKTNISLHNKKNQASLMYGGDSKLYKVLKQNKYELVPNSAEFTFYCDTIVEAEYVLNYLKRKKIEKSTLVDIYIRYRNNTWKMNMKNVLGGIHNDCGCEDVATHLDFDSFNRFVRSLLSYQSHTQEDFFKDSIYIDHLEKQRIIDSTRMAKELKKEQFERQKYADSIVMELEKKKLQQRIKDSISNVNKN